jgi:hypothetical protein
VAYPMIQWPTFTEFRDRLVNEVGCKYIQLPGSITVDDGEPKPVFYFERDLGGGNYRRYVVAIPDDERLAPSVIRSICRLLAVDPAMFGLTLG